MSQNDDFVRSIENATLKMVGDTTKNMNKACIVLEGAAKEGCPVDQGLLRASMTHEVMVDEQGITGIVGSNLEYAPYVHNGTGIYAKEGNGRKTPWGYMARKGKYKGFHFTVGQRPQPFLEDAKLAKMKQIERALGGK